MKTDTNRTNEFEIIYSAPRRFDLMSMFLMLTAFALAFGVCQSLNARPILMLYIASFLTLVGLSQAVLWEGSKPRAASIVTGGLLFLLPFGLAVTNWMINGGVPTTNALDLLLLPVFYGMILGYLAGVLIGALFWLAEGLRNRLLNASVVTPVLTSPFDPLGFDEKE